MNTIILGYLSAFLASIFFTIYIVPKKLSKQKPIYYTMFVGLGFFVISLIFYIGQLIIKRENAEPIFNPVLIFSAITGILWMIGSLLLLTSIDKIGLSRTSQWKNLQRPLGSILVLLFFSEFLTTNLIYLLLAIVVTFISAMLFTIKNDGEKRVETKNIIYAVSSAVLFGINALLTRYVKAAGFLYVNQLYFSLFVFISAIVYVLIKDKNLKELKNIKDKNNMLGILGGSLYYFASYFSVNSFTYIPGSIGLTIAQLDSVWTILTGIVIFKEIEFTKHWVRITIGLMLALIGVILLFYANK